MTNPIKRFFQILKAIVLFPLSFLQMRRAYQDIEKLRRLPKDPEKMRKLLAEMGLEDEMMPFFVPMMPQQSRNQEMIEVDLSYLEDKDEDEDDTFDD
ncbi:MAG: hypothetical protein HWN65_16505 [Candidatus Helarchaeota archaeon]|nr:hypothetical protein [Candidatus Helarchaeota archaeon]